MSGAIVLVAALAGAVASLVAFAEHSGDDVYGIPGWGLGLATGLTVLVAAGCLLAWWSRDAAFSALIATSAAFGVFGILSLLSVGVLALGIAVGLAVWAGMARSGERRASAAVGGALVGGPLPLLVVLALSNPVVDCQRGATTSGENFFMGLTSDSAESSVTDAPDGSSSGSARGDSYRYSYECRDGRLVRFDLRWR